jgi:hypothetical protein
MHVFLGQKRLYTQVNRMGKLVNLASFLALNLLVAGLVATPAPPTGQEKEITFKISVRLEFKGRDVSGELRKAEVEELLDLPVRNGNTDPNEGYGVEMTMPNREKVMVYTCREWRQARAKDAYSATTYDMTMEGYLIHACGLLIELQRAKLPLKSFVANPRVSLANLNLLPATILSGIPDDAKERERLRSMTVSEAVSPRDIEKTDDEMLTLSYGGIEQSFWEGARADFNGDGIEDILVFTGGQAEGGTMGYSDYFILTRTGPSGPLKLIQTSEPQQKTDR